MSENRKIQELLAKNIEGLYQMSEMLQNEPESLKKVEIPSKTRQIGLFLDQNPDTASMVAKIVAEYTARLSAYGIEAGLAGQMAKDLSRTLWDRLLGEMGD